MVTGLSTHAAVISTDRPLVALVVDGVQYPGGTWDNSAGLAAASVLISVIYEGRAPTSYGEESPASPQAVVSVIQ